MEVTSNPWNLALQSFTALRQKSHYFPAKSDLAVTIRRECRRAVHKHIQAGNGPVADVIRTELGRR
jgi:hypothetical protein